MYNRIIKSKNREPYQKWLEENNYSLLSSKHRGLYAEQIFLEFCAEQGISAQKINPKLPVLYQIPYQNIKKTAQKELRILQKLPINYFCQWKDKQFFSILKMGTSVPSKVQKELAQIMSKNELYLFHVFEDAEILVRRLNKKIDRNL